MDRVLVEVFVPASGQTFDTILPCESKLHEVILLLSHTMNELSEGQFIVKDDTVLCDRKTGEILNINLTVEELGIFNGAKLMLI